MTNDTLSIDLYRLLCLRNTSRPSFMFSNTYAKQSLMFSQKTAYSDGKKLGFT